MVRVGGEALDYGNAAKNLKSNPGGSPGFGGEVLMITTEIKKAT